MAKISARGDSAARTWTHDNGCRMVLTVQGRLLRNYLKGDTLSLVGKAVTLAQAQDRADRLGFVAR